MMTTLALTSNSINSGHAHSSLTRDSTTRTFSAVLLVFICSPFLIGVALVHFPSLGPQTAALPGNSVIHPTVGLLWKLSFGTLPFGWFYFLICVARISAADRFTLRTLPSTIR